jgi:apolipoprotein N-acyltransferase
MRVADYRMYATWIGLSISCALFFPIGLFLVRRLDHRTRLPLILTFPAVWAALEYVRAHLFTGFPWYFLCHSQHNVLPLIQFTDVTGSYGVSFLIAAVNVLVFEILFSWGWLSVFFRGATRRLANSIMPIYWQALVIGAFVALALGYGFWRLSQNEFRSGPVVALIQGNLDQAVRIDATNSVEAAIAEVEEHYGRLTDEATSKESKPALVVWPETSYPHEWLEVAPNVASQQIPPGWSREIRIGRARARDQAARWRSDLLVGANCSVLTSSDKFIRYNSAILTRTDGGFAGRYDKIHCVPFGEYVPLKDWLPLMSKLAPYDFDYSVHEGEHFTRFRLGDYHFGVLICYEDTDPYLARQYVRSDAGGPPVDFLINISNDGWFHGTSEHEQHLAICRFRAIECRRSVARAVNMGISGVIDGNGRVIALPGTDWSKSKKIEAVLTAGIPIDQRTSLYAQWGDWFPWTCAGLVVAGVVWSLFPLGPRPRTMLG